MLIFGSLIIIAACGGMGLIFAHRIRRRPQELRECLLALSLLDTEIFWGSTPLPEAFSILKERLDGPWRGFFGELEDRLLQGESANSAWKNAIVKQKSNFCLQADDWLVIRDLGKGLGRSDRQEQHKQLELMQHQIASIKELAGNWAEKQAKMWSYLGFLIGIAGVIFLI